VKKILGILGAIVAAAALAAPLLAEEDPARELVGTWRRDDGRNIQIRWDANAQEFTGVMLDPPENSVAKVPYQVALHLRRDGKKVTGKAVWTDTDPKLPGPAAADALWELELTEPGKLKGRSESFSFGHGKVTDKQWDDHELVRLPEVDVGPPVPESQALFVGGIVTLPSDWKRDDGLYLRLDASGEGDLVSASGEMQAHVKLALQSGGRLSGTALWKQAGVEARWDLFPQDDGTLLGSCECGTVVAKTRTLRRFKPLRKLG
jgi:hypothetical protein